MYQVDAVHENEALESRHGIELKLTARHACRKRDSGLETAMPFESILDILFTF